MIHVAPFLFHFHWYPLVCGTSSSGWNYSNSLHPVSLPPEVFANWIHFPHCSQNVFFEYKSDHVTFLVNYIISFPMFPEWNSTDLLSFSWSGPYLPNQFQLLALLFPMPTCCCSVWMEWSLLSLSIKSHRIFLTLNLDAIPSGKFSLTLLNLYLYMSLM